MILYNVTMNVEHSIETEWLSWMKQIHVPEVLNTRCFVDCKIFKLLSEDNEGTTYAFQYFAETRTHIVQYQGLYGAKLQSDVYQRYGNKVMSFRTLLEEVV